MATKRSTKTNRPEKKRSSPSRRQSSASVDDVKQGTSSLADRDQLITRYQRFVNGLVGKLIRTLSLPSDQTDEYVAAGYLGLVEAAERFDPNSGVEFSTYAYLRIRGAVIDSVRESSYLSAKALRFAKGMQAAHELREAEVLGRSKEQGKPGVAEMLDSVASGALVHRLCGDSGHDALTHATAVSQTPESLMEEDQGRSEIREWVGTLPEKERAIIEDYYFRGKSFTDIVESSEGMSKSWVSRLHSRALQQLKERIVFQGITPLKCEKSKLQSGTP